MTNEQDVLQHIGTLERPQWMFWGDRKAAVQAIARLGAAAGTRAIAVLGEVVSKRGVKWDTRNEAAQALAKLGPAAEPALPSLLRFLTDMEKEGDSIFQGPIPISALEAVGAMGATARSAVPTLVQIVVKYAGRSAKGALDIASGRARPASGNISDIVGFALGQTMQSVIMHNAAKAVGDILGQPREKTDEASLALVKWWNAEGKNQNY